MKTLKDFKNELLNRREVAVEITSDGNPGFTGATKAIVDEFGAKEENIVIKGVEGKFGTDVFLIRAFIYDSAEIKNKIEPRAKVRKEKKA